VVVAAVRSLNGPVMIVLLTVREVASLACVGTGDGGAAALSGCGEDIFEVVKRQNFARGINVSTSKSGFSPSTAYNERQQRCLLDTAPFAAKYFHTCS